MPKEFTDCIKNGGRIFTVEAGAHHFIHGCQPKGGGKAVYGERKRKKVETKNKNKS